jgi:capsular polysaccharide export protein
MRNSFPGINFVPVKRIRHTDYFDVSHYDRIPSSMLRNLLDNNAIDAINEADEITLVTDILCDFLYDYDSFESDSYFIVDQGKVQQFRALLPHSKPLVGISWRSNLTTHTRHEHYLTVEELEPLLQVEGVQFVNFQYDECSEELAWIEERYPGKVINLPDIDQYNDLDSVAALMKCMDLMIAPCTTVVELSGALGCPTWLFANSSELLWRKRPGSNQDVWHHSVEIVHAERLQDKALLAQVLSTKLRAWIEQKDSPDRQRQLAI